MLRTKDIEIRGRIQSFLTRHINDSGDIILYVVNLLIIVSMVLIFLYSQIEPVLNFLIAEKDNGLG